jgi:hypothetical protein
MPLPPPIPVDRFLTPDAPLETPDGFISVDQPISAGLPHVIDLENDLKLLVIVPTGLIAAWRDADPVSVVSRGDEETLPVSPPPQATIADASHAPARLLLTVGGDFLASAPLVTGVRQFAPNLESGVRIELLVLSWLIHAGTLRGPGDFGSRISLAWRRASDAINQFSTPPPNPVLVPSLPPANRTESTLGLQQPTQRVVARFDLKRTIVP